MFLDNGHTVQNYIVFHYQILIILSNIFQRIRNGEYSVPKITFWQIHV